jgi:hypothetical protein
MFDAFWSDFKRKIFIFCFLPYLVYFICCEAYIVMMLFMPGESSEQWEFAAEDLEYLDTYEGPLRALVLILLVSQIIIEVK